MKRRLLKIAAVLAAFAAGGLLVMVSGIIPVKASSGHWPITAWFLNFAMSRSVSTHSIGIEPPRELDHPGRILRGAGHYETGCRPCHGSPDLERPRIPLQMTPHPPYLPLVVSQWKPEELFTIVKHGVKFTGMPAFPSQQRDDEVWAVVAFLLEFPELDAEAYRRLVYGQSQAGDLSAPIEGLEGAEDPPLVINQSCGRCHGADGMGRGAGAFPILAGQRPAYLAAAMEAYADGSRHSGIMEPIAAGLDADEIRATARYYSQLKPPAASPSEAAAGDSDVAQQIERGARIATAGVPGEKVPACAACHGPGRTRRNPRYPLLAGQDAQYLVQQLELFQHRHRGGSEYAHLMHPVADWLTPDAARDVAAYYASLEP